MIEAMFWNTFWRSLAPTHTHTHTIRSLEWLLFRSCGGISRSVTHAATVSENKRFYRDLQEVTPCVKLPLSPTKVPNVYRNRRSIWTASYRMDNTDENHFCNLFKCSKFVPVPFVTFPVGITFTWHRDTLALLPECHDMTLDWTSDVYNFGFRGFAVACVGVNLMFRRTLQLPSLGRMRQ